MIPKNGNAAQGGGQVAALENRKPKSVKHTANANAEQFTYGCGKRAAIHAYCWGWLSLHSTQELFSRNPSWRSA